MVSIPLLPISRIISQDQCKDGTHLSTIEILVGDWMGGNFETLITTESHEWTQRYKTEEEAVREHENLVQQHGGIVLSSTS
jgi:hypothetical protein